MPRPDPRIDPALYLLSGEAARLAGCSVQWLHRCADAGRLHPLEAWGLRLWLRSELEALRDERAARRGAA